MNRPYYLLFFLAMHFLGYSHVYSQRIVNETQKQELEAELAKTKQDTQRVRLLNELAKAYRRSNATKSRAFSEEAVALSEQLNYPLGKAHAQSNLAKLIGQQGKTEEAIKMLRELQQVYIELDDTASQINTAFAIGGYFQMQTANDSCFLWFRRAYKTAVEDEDQYHVMLALNALGNTFKSMAEYDSAVVYYRQSLEISNERKDNYFSSALLNNIGSCYYDQGDMPVAQLLYLSALELGGSAIDSFLIAIYYVNIGGIYIWEGEYDASITLFKSAYDQFEKADNIPHMALSMYNMAMAAEGKDDLELAGQYYLQAAHLYQSIDDPYSLALSYESLGWVAETEGRYKDALEYDLKAAEIKEELGENKELVEIYTTIGNVALKAHEPALGVQYAAKSLRIARKKGLQLDERKNYTSLAENNAALGNFEAAYKYQERYNEVKDSLQNELVTQQIANASAQFETNEAQKKSRLLVQQNRIQALELSRGYYIIGTLGGLLLLLSVLFFFKTRIFSFNREVATELFKFILARLKRKKFLFVKVDGQMIRILEEEILWIKAAKDYAEIFLVEKRLLVHSTMKNLEAKLPTQDFLRVHRSYIVRIDQIEGMKGKSFLLIKEEKIPVGETYRNSLQPIREKMDLLN